MQAHPLFHARVPPCGLDAPLLAEALFVGWAQEYRESAPNAFCVHAFRSLPPRQSSSITIRPMAFHKPTTSPHLPIRPSTPASIRQEDFARQAGVPSRKLVVIHVRFVQSAVRLLSVEVQRPSSNKSVLRAEASSWRFSGSKVGSEGYQRGQEVQTMIPTVQR